MIILANVFPSVFKLARFEIKGMCIIVSYIPNTNSMHANTCWYVLVCILIHTKYIVKVWHILQYGIYCSGNVNTGIRVLEWYVALLRGKGKNMIHVSRVNDHHTFRT